MKSTEPVPCAHERKIPHRKWDTGAWRWTCSDCYQDLRPWEAWHRA